MYSLNLDMLPDGIFIFIVDVEPLKYARVGGRPAATLYVSCQL
jgi:hypothetical protein